MFLRQLAKKTPIKKIASVGSGVVIGGAAVTWGSRPKGAFQPNFFSRQTTNKQTSSMYTIETPLERAGREFRS
jgi:hypothetical protein